MFNSVEQRKRQIDTLKIFNDNVFEIQNDEKYGIKFHSGANEVKLIIELDQEFPYKIPKLTLEPNLNHSWIENGEITKFAGLRNFTSNSDLGRVCQAIIREFEKNPPGLVSDSPSVPAHSSITELNVLDAGQLFALLNDEQYMDDFVEELSPIKALNVELDTLIEDTEMLAKQNLQKDAALTELKTSVEKLSVEFIKLCSHYNQTNRKYEDKAKEYSPENIRQMLEIGVSNAECLCEETVESFLEGNQSLPEFLENFMKVKKLISTRKFKEERLNFQLNQLKL